MGVTHYSYHNFQEVTLEKRIDMGDRRDPSKAFIWNNIFINLTGT